MRRCCSQSLHSFTAIAAQQQQLPAGNFHAPQAPAQLIPPMYTAVYVHGRVHDPHLAPKRLCARPVHGRAHVYTARTRPWTRPMYTAVCTYKRPVYESYKICNFLTNSCDCIRKQSKAPYCLSPEVY